MYWTHLIFALVFGTLQWAEWSRAVKPGYLDFDNLPDTNFSCDGKVIGGYYADVETGCQMFHVCTIGQKAEVTDIKFLCLNGTVFDQETRVCERIDEVDCSKSEDFFGLNLELYGNHAGIQPEFECEDCNDDEEYEDLTTTVVPSTTSSTTPSTTTTKTTTGQPDYPTPSPETIAALLALHNHFSQGLNQQEHKLKPPPPRVINNAFSPTTDRYAPNRHINLSLKTRYSPEEPGDYYPLTTAAPKSNYHHFHNPDTSFGHSFDPNSKPYNFQYFRPRPPKQAEVSVVTSTSTSTSVKTSAKNSTDYPTGYDDEYGDDSAGVVDEYFSDVPKIRSKREERHKNHKYPDETTRHPNHKYDGEVTTDQPPSEKPQLGNEKPLERDEFLQNLLGSLDLDDRARARVSEMFKSEGKKEMNLNERGLSLVEELRMRLGETVLADVKETIHGAKRDLTSVLSLNNSLKVLDGVNELWESHYKEMSKEVEMRFDEVVERPKREARRPVQSVPVFEEIEGDLTTAQYTRPPTTVSKPPATRRGRRRTTTTPLTPVSHEFRSRNVTREVSHEFRPRNVTRDVKKLRNVPVHEELESDQSRREDVMTSPIAQNPPKVPNNGRRNRGRGSVRGSLVQWTEPPRPTAPPPTPTSPPDPNFNCKGRVKGGFYADIVNDCRGFFICSQGQINGPLLKSHFWCGSTTKFNQRSRTCQAEDLVDCSISERYFHLNNDFLVPQPEEEIKPKFESQKVK